MAPPEQPGMPPLGELGAGGNAGGRGLPPAGSVATGDRAAPPLAAVGSGHRPPAATVTADVAVLGGGIIALSLAFELVERGARVVVVERERPGTGASQAAAGMLAPGHEAGSDPCLLQLGLFSYRLWPAFARRLEAVSGIATGLVTRGVAVAAHTDHEATLLRARAEQEGATPKLRWVPAGRLPRYLRGWGQLRGALLFPDGGHVDPVATVAALYQALAGKAELWTGTNLVAYRQQPQGREQRVVEVLTTRGTIAAGAYVLAAGTGSPALAAPLGVRIPVHPVKGQILAVEPPPALQPLVAGKVPVFAHGIYLVPRRDGRLLIGATEEPTAGTDRSVTLGALHQLLAAALDVAPPLADARWLEARSGLRPGTPDRRPLLGPLPGYANVWVATGHYRNGVLLAPATARSMAALLAGQEPETDLAPFDPGRPGLAEPPAWPQEVPSDVASKVP